MVKKKRSAEEKGCSTYHIESVNLEIDYEKLAEAIVKANNTAEAQKRQNKPQQNRPFWRKVWEIWSNKRDTDGQFTAAAFNLEIDYEKLAEAIVKANNTAATQKRQSKPQQNRPFWKKIWEIWSDKRDTDGQFMVATFSSIISAFFKTIAIASVVIAGFLLIIGLEYSVFELTWTWTWENTGFHIMLILAIGVVSFLTFLFATVFWGASNEMEREQDKNYILSVFSGIVALITLIVTLITLYGRR